MPGYARSLKSGEPENTTTSRAVIFEAAAANSAPTTSDKQMVGMGTFSAVDLVLQCTVGGGSFDAKVWWWYEAVGAWVLDTAIGTVSMTTVIGTKRVAIVTPASVPCASGCYVEVLNFAGGGKASAWLVGR